MTYEEHVIKKKSGKLRKIVAPDPELKQYQKSRIPYLYKEFKKLASSNGVLHSFHGFLPNRNAVTAAHMHIGFNTTIMFDLENFFDNVVEHHLYIQGLELSEKDKDLLLHKLGYAAQGFPSSPMVANIAAIPIIEEIKRKMKGIHKKYVITIYADDIQISINTEDKQSIDKIKENVIIASSSFGFKINPNKTRVRFQKYGYRKILGLNVGRNDIQPTRKTNRKVRAVAQQVSKGTDKGCNLGGLRTWQKCKYPKGIEFQF